MHKLPLVVRALALSLVLLACGDGDDDAKPVDVVVMTRNVFLGWLRTYISVALWPVLFAFAERLALAIPWSAWLGVADGAVDGWDFISRIMQGEMMLLIFNITFFFVYLSIPIASHLIVSGASRPFRTL